MRDTQKLNLLLAELGSHYGIPNLKLPAHGAVGLRLKDGSELYFEHEDAQGTLYACMPVMPLPTDGAARLKLMSAMLELNYLNVGIEHGTLSIDKEQAVCHVAFTVASLQFDVFDRGLQKLIAGRAGVLPRLQAVLRADNGTPIRARHSAATLLATFK